MRALVQRVSSARVRVDGRTVAAIGPGLLVLLGIARADDEATARRLADKVRALRVFDDAQGRMNEPLGDRELLCVSQFTLYGDTAAAATARASPRPPTASTPSRCTSASASTPAHSAACSARACSSSSRTTVRSRCCLRADVGNRAPGVPSANAADSPTPWSMVVACGQTSRTKSSAAT